MLIDCVLLLAEMPADHAFLNRPRQTSFVRLKSSGYQFLFFGQRGLRRFIRLFADHFVNLLVQLRYFLLLLLELFVQIFLFALQLAQHILLLAFVTFELVLLTFTGVQNGQLVMFVRFQQIVLHVNLCLRVLYPPHLLLTVTGELSQVSGTAC